MILLEGHSLAARIEAEIAEVISRRSAPPPGLAVLLVGNDPASHTYVRAKQRRSAAVGITSHLIALPADVSEEELLDTVEQLNRSPEIDAILVQLPLPRSIDPLRVIDQIDPEKDVDGLHPLNLGRLLRGEEGGLLPCTPQAIHALLLDYKIPIDGAHVVIVGRSQIVGRPLAALLSQKRHGCNATVTLAHSHTQELHKITRQADILVAALGSPNLFGPEMVCEGAVVVDVGINRIDDPTKSSGYRLVGDVDFEPVSKICSAITPVPGGIGPLTIAMLLRNCLQIAERRW